MPARLLRLASDERLVDHLRGGSEAAFEAIFDRHHRGVLGFCRHMLGSVEEAEDALQHTFLAAYRELVGSGKAVQLRPWLYTIARNRCLTVLRSRTRHAPGEIREPPTEHLAAAVERRQDLRALLGDVARLPDDQRAALVLSELGDMPHDEIADVLGCRREKVKALVFQARSSLIASRTARDTSCADIRELLANLTGGSLRRNEVRRHLAECAGCREFREEVRRQRRELALVLPVAPTVGLKATVVGSAVGGSAIAAGSGAGAGAVAAKVLVVAALVGGGTAAVEVKSSGEPAAPVPTRSGPSGHGGPSGGGGRGYEPAPATRSGSPSGRVGSTGAAAPLRGPHARRPRAGRGKESSPGSASNGRAAKPAKPEKPVKAAKPEKPVKAAKPVRAAKPVKPETHTNGANVSSAPRSPKVAKPDTATARAAAEVHRSPRAATRSSSTEEPSKSPGQASKLEKEIKPLKTPTA